MLRRGRGQLREDAETAGGFAEDGDVQRVAAEEEDVVANPTKSELLIHQAVIAGRTGGEITIVVGIGFFVGEGGVGEKAERAQAIVAGHDDDAVLDEGRGIVVITFAGDERAAVDPEHDRARTGEYGGVWRVDIEEEAMRGDGGQSKGWRGVGAVVGEFGGCERGKPRGVRNGRLPSKVSDWRCSVGNAQKFANTRG